MSDFLEFLNSADAETLTKTPGITNALAEGLISARPFAGPEDCLKVRGMGKGLLSRLQSAFEAQQKPGDGRALQPVEADAAPIPVVNISSRESASVPGPSFGSRLRDAFVSFLRGLVRLLALLIILGAIVALVYYGRPAIRTYLMGPVQQNTEEITQLRADLAAMQTQVTNLQTELDLANSRVDAIDQSLAAQSATLARLEELQVTLETNMNTGDAKLTADLAREVKLTRAIEYLSRARLYLSQSNFGLARADVQAARDLLADVQTNFPDDNPEALAQVLTRLDLALGNLPGFPVVAVGDVDIALELLLSDLPSGATAPTSTPTPALQLPSSTAELPTSTPLPDFTATPTAAP
jgi:hypothetical protein